jgi:hypothetical protein
MSEPEGMRLDEYVAETLVAIVGGVMKAQANTECGAYVGRATAATSHLEIGHDGAGNTVSLVKFDLATTVDEKRAGGAGAGIKVIPFFNVSGEAKGESASSLVSRIAFSVSIAIPMPTAQKAENDARDRANSAAMDRFSFER